MARLQLMFKERRIKDRKLLTGVLPGKLIVQLDGQTSEVIGKPVDVSRNGLGLIISQQLDPGTEVTLQMQDHNVAFQIAWGQRDFGKQDMFRYGLVTLNPEDNVESIFLRTGCLR